MDINNFSFKYNQLSQSNHPMMPVLFEAVITDNLSKVSYGTKFQFPPGHQINNSAVFNNFCDKNNFKQNWWVELVEVKPAAPPEIKVDITPESVKVDVEIKEDVKQEIKSEPEITNN